MTAELKLLDKLAQSKQAIHMNKKFLLIIVTAFTLTVPGFLYFFILAFRCVQQRRRRTGLSALQRRSSTAASHQGDYNKTGGEVVKTKQTAAKDSRQPNASRYSIYFENAMNTGKPNLRSAGGCIRRQRICPQSMCRRHLKEEGRESITHRYQKRLSASPLMRRQLLRSEKSGLNSRALSTKVIVLKFPLVQLVRENGRQRIS
jgi:hypothetical protein